MNYNPINSPHNSWGRVKFTFVLFLLIFVGLVNKAVGQEAYAVYNDKVLTFYYDTQRASRTGTVYNLNTGTNHPGWTYSGSTYITTVIFTEDFKNARPTTCYGWFHNCANLTSIIGLEYLNTSEVTNMSYMFYWCESLKSLDVTKFNTGNVTNMSYMFYDCVSLKSLDVTKFNTANVTDMRCMFFLCRSLTALDVTKFNTEKVTDMSDMFGSCTSLKSLDVTKFNTGNVTNMLSMFGQCSSLTTLDVTKFNTEKVRNMGLLFYYCSSLTTLDLSNFNTANVTAMNSMFCGCSSLTTLVVTNFNTANVTNMMNMFQGCSSLTSLDITNFNTAKVSNMHDMFNGCSSLTSLDITNFNTAKVMVMYDMFNGCTSLTTLDLSAFDTQKVTRMYRMFSGCNNLTSILVSDKWNLSHLYSGQDNDYDIFKGCTSLKGEKGTEYDESKTDKVYAHIDGGATDPGYLSAGVIPYAVVSTDKTTLTFYYDNQWSSREGTIYELNKGSHVPKWANYSSSITTVIFNNTFKNAHPTSCYAWFSGFNNLTSIIGLEYLNTSEVTNMDGMFNACSRLTTLLVDESNWKTDKVTSSIDMFKDSPELIGNKGTTYTSSKIDIAYAHIDEGVSNPGYLTTGKYKIFYNGIDDDNATLDTYTNAITEFINEEVTLVEPKKDGYEFTGWTGTTITGLTTTPTKNVTIAKGEVGNRIYTAHWKAKITLSVAINGWIYGSTPSTPIVKKNNTEISLSDVVLKYTDENNQEITPSSTTSIGTYTITATYPESDTELSATASTTFTISPLVINLNDPNIASLLSIVLNPDSYIYDGKAKEPAVTITFNGLEVPAAEYTVSYQDNINAGTAKAIITDNPNGNYTINANKNFTIKPGKISITPSNTDTDGAILADASNEYFCKGKAVIDFTIQNGTLDNYSIEFDGGEISSQNGAITGNSIEIALPKGLLPGTYNGFMELTSNDGNSTGKLPIRVIINLPFYTIVTLYNDVAAVNQLAGEFSAYKWTENGNEISGANGRILQHTFNKSSVYTAILTKTDGGSYETCPLDLSRISVGNSTARLVVYPNPATQGNDITVEVSENYNPEANKQIYIYNLNGTLAKHLSSPQEINKVQLPTGNYSGVYIQNGEKVPFKLIVK